MKLVDMARTAEEIKGDCGMMPTAHTPLYDYGLTLRLCNESIEKLDLDADDVEVGDLLDFRAMAKVTSISSHDGGEGERKSIELQIIMMGVPENESHESDDDEE